MPTSYTAKTWTPGDQGNAANLNTYVRDNFTFFRQFNGCRVYMNANQALNTSTLTKLQFNAETADPWGWFDATTNYRWTPQVAGYYRITVRAIFDSVSGRHRLSLYKNGAELGPPYWEYGDSARERGVSLDDVVSMNGSSDYLEVYGYHENGSARNVLGGQYTSFLIIELIGV